MEYKYYGWENDGIRPNSDVFSTISSPQRLYDLLSELWSEETCAPRMRSEWSPSNRTKGQCSITAFLAQDIFGGKVYGVPLSDGNFHCYNVVDEQIFDLTSEQFGKITLSYENNPEQSREVHFQKQEKRERYELLKKRLFKKIVEDIPITSGIWRHFKGNEYEVLFLAKNSENLEDMVVYRGLSGDRKIWVRPASMWNEIVEKDGIFCRRFEFIGSK